ncbi:MAG: transaldolase [Planctomycetaceae bacterium]|nr:transaldolase [Planctomycetaceae bacterium]
MSPLKSLITCGTKLWLDSVQPDLVQEYRQLGATGATSNPVIIAGIIKAGLCDQQLTELLATDADDEKIAWTLTDQLVRDAQQVFLPVWEETKGNDGYVSFELDPLLEAVDCPLSIPERSARYIELGKQWAAGHSNRLIKVPATPAGLGALEELAAAGVSLNVTLLFTSRQYQAARDAIWRGAQRCSNPEQLKSVYSIFVSRIDGYTAKHVPTLSDAAQGQVAIANAKLIWKENVAFWKDKPVDHSQDIVFASMGTKDPADSPDKYVAALAGSDVQTNPPTTNAAVEKMEGRVFTRSVDLLPSPDVLEEINEKVDFEHLEQTLMDDGLKKFADPQLELLASIAARRS